MFQRLTQRTDQLQHHIRTTDWVRVSGEIALVGLAICFGTVINIYLSVDAAAQLDWTLADVGFGDTGAGAVLLGILAGGVFGPLTYLVFAATERTRRLDSPVRRWLTVAVGPAILIIWLYFIAFMIFVVLEPAEAAAQFGGLDAAEAVVEIYEEIESDIWALNRLIAVFAIPTALAVLVHTGLRRGVSLRGRQTQAVALGLVLLLLVPTAAASVTAPHQPPAVDDEGDAGAEYDYQMQAFKPASESVLACRDDSVTVEPTENNSDLVAEPYEPTATFYGTDHLWVARYKRVPESGGDASLDDDWFHVELRPDGETAATDGQVLGVDVYNRTPSDDYYYGTTDTVSGDIDFDDDTRRLHIAADVVLADGQVRRYVFPLCPPSGGGE